MRCYDRHMGVPADVFEPDLIVTSDDETELAAVLVRSEVLRSEGESEFALCELDSDLQPWDKGGGRKEPLIDFYDAAGVWVYGDFVLKTPPRPDGWTGGVA